MRDFAIANPRLSSAADIGPYRRMLAGGLRVVLYVGVDHVWHMSAYRLGVLPSRKEIEILKRDFSVPAEVKEQTVAIPGDVPPEQQWMIVRLRWIETEQVPLFEVGPKGDNGPTYY